MTIQTPIATAPGKSKAAGGPGASGASKAAGRVGGILSSPIRAGLNRGRQSVALGQRFFRRARACWMIMGAVPALLVASGVISIFVPPQIAESLLREDLRQNAFLWQQATLNAVEHGSHILDGAPVSQRDDDRLRLLASSTEFYRMKIFAADGTIIWSSRRAEIGNRTDKPYFTDQVMHGRVFTKFDIKDASEVEGFASRALYGTARTTRTVGEIYVPVLDNGAVLGAIEFYTDLTDVEATLLYRVRFLLISILGLGNLMALASAIWFTRSTRVRAALEQERANRDAEAMARQIQLAREVQLLGDLNEWLQSADTMAELFDMVSRFMTHILPFAEGSIYVYSNSRDVLDGWACWNGGHLHEHIRPDDCWGLRRGRTYTYGAAEVSFPCRHSDRDDDRAYFCFPILAHGETVGLMHIRSAQGDTVEEFRSCQKLAQMCAEQISMAIANVRMRDQLREQSVRDPLTGMFNRRHMNETLRRFLEGSRRNGDPVSVLSIDVDHFKKFNDNHGHDAGDMVLQAVAEVLEQNVEGDEVACRPGGEEFAVLLPGLAPEAAVERAERIRRAIEAVQVHYGDGDLPRITISVGVAHAPQQALLVQDLLKIADEALYEAKANGRNQVVDAGAAKSAGSAKETNGPESKAQRVAAVPLKGVGGVAPGTAAE